MIYSIVSLLLLLPQFVDASVPRGNLRASTIDLLPEDSISSSSSAGTIISELEMMEIISEDMEFEPWIPTKKAFSHDPMEIYTESLLRSTPGVEEYTEFNTGGALVVDMVDRFLRRGYLSKAFPSLIAFQQWVVMNSNADPNFRARYAFLPKPNLVSNSKFFWGGSPGLELGQFRTITIGNPNIGVPAYEWKETAMVYKILPVPNCVQTPLDTLVGATPSSVFVLLAGQRKYFFAAGSVVTEAVDTKGNRYFMLASRGAGPNPTVPSPNGPVVVNTLPPGWTLNRARVLTTDFSSKCLYSKSVPKNKDGEDGVICKELQVSDLSGSVFLLAELAGTESFTLPDGNLLVAAGTPPTCVPFTLTGAYQSRPGEEEDDDDE